MKYLIFIFFFCIYNISYSQLGFCSGSKGDPIFHETFGNGTGTGDELSQGITDYRFVKQDPQDGEYTISDDIGDQITSWHSNLATGNISGGRALIVNADFTAGRFYRKEISGLCENTTYEFSAFLMNVYDRASNICEDGGIPNNVRFEIWDETDSFLINSGDTPNINSTSTAVWEQFALTFRSEPGQDAVILKMFNNGEGGCGNDLAIDDIIFRSCGDLTTISTNGETGNTYKICEEETPVRIILEARADSSVYQQQFYQWQISLNGQDWGNIPGANSSSYETSEIRESYYYRVKVAEDENNLGSSVCSSASEAFYISVIYPPDPPQSTGDLTICQNEPAPALRVTSKEGMQVNWYDQETGGVLLAENTETYFPTSAGRYYAEAVNPAKNCASSSRTAVRLTIITLPSLEEEDSRICPDASLLLTAGASGYDYLWSTGETTESIMVNSEGSYSVDVISEQGCYITQDFNVQLVENAKIDDVISSGEDVQIIPHIAGDFEYSLDGANYQNSPGFPSLAGGVYTAYMRDFENCKTDTLRFAHIVVPKMISPNNDGFNDRFQLKGVEFFKKSRIEIYDRYGKLIKAGKGEGFNWDGILNGKRFPADDYWYRIKIDGFEEKTGHFSLVR